MPIVVTGARGQLGRAVCACLGAEATPLDRSALDVSDPQAVRRFIIQHRPEAIINCAAYTQVDRAEQEPELCRRANALAVGHLSKECREAGVRLVQISTDYVFGGDATRSTPFEETDEPSPQGVYARSKREGEQLAAICEDHLIIRTCGLYGPSSHGMNFVETMLRLARQDKPLRVVDDQWCTPSNAAHVAEAVVLLLHRGVQGTWHVVNAGATTWFRFAQEIFAQTGLNVAIEPITTEAYGAPAPRPRYSVLDTRKYQHLTGAALPSWSDALAEYLRLRP